MWGGYGRGSCQSRWFSGIAVVSGGPGFETEFDALVPFGKASILVYKSLGDDLKPSLPWSLTYKHTHAFLSVR